MRRPNRPARNWSTTAAIHATASVAVLASQALVATVTGYLGWLTVAGWRAHLRGERMTVVSEAATHRFLVLVPAHDEEGLIGSTLQSLAQLDYPAAHVAVHVVADNCTDGTARVAKAFDVEVHERTAPDDRGKGPALNWLLRTLQERDEPHDAIVFVDADSVVSRNFLRVVDAKLLQGERVVQGHYAVREPGGSWPAAMRGAALAVRHYLRPLARTSMGGSAGLHGNGMAFAADLLQGREWSAHLTEDIELEAQLLLQGVRVAFAPDALVEAQMPDDLRDAETQNERWERGRVEVAKRYVPLLLRAAVDPGRRHRGRYVDAAVDHLVPPLTLVGAAAATSGALSLGLWLLRSTRLSRGNLALAAGVSATQAAYLVSALRMVRAPASVWMALLRTPLFVGWKVRMTARALSSGGSPAWVRTTRNAAAPRARGAS